MFGFLKKKLNSIKEKLSDTISTKTPETEDSSIYSDSPDIPESPKPSEQPKPFSDQPITKEQPKPEIPKPPEPPKAPEQEKPEIQKQEEKTQETKKESLLTKEQLTPKKSEIEKTLSKQPTPKEQLTPKKSEIEKTLSEQPKPSEQEKPTPTETPEQPTPEIPKQEEPKKEKKSLFSKIISQLKPEQKPKPEKPLSELPKSPEQPKQPEIETPIPEKIQPEEKHPEIIKEKEIIPELKQEPEIKEIEPSKIETRELKKPEEKKQPKLSILTKAKSFITQKVKLQENEIDDLLFDIELSLIQADVEANTAKQLTTYMKESLLEKEFSKNNLQEQLDLAIQEAVSKLIDIPYPNLLEEIKTKNKPVKILFFGPNGAGKTTTIAKLAEHLKHQNLTSVFAAADTFRAASIEQIKKHAERLDIKVVSHTYGADPAAVAFDAIKSAEANKTDVVLIDTAGRQETNKNLLKELEKIVRISKPDYKIYVGESISGTAILNQAKEFDKEFGLDGFILTKLDLDPKGGSALSLIYNLKKPIFFFGTGQTYKDLKHFSKQELLNQIF